MARRKHKATWPSVSIREAAKRLDCNAGWLKGVVDAIGIILYPTGVGLFMSEDDFSRLKAKVEEILLVSA